MFEFSVSKFAVLVIALFVSLMGTFAVGSEGVVSVWGTCCGSSATFCWNCCKVMLITSSLTGVTFCNQPVRKLCAYVLAIISGYEEASVDRGSPVRLVPMTRS